ncbi:MAG: spherulation-specific family 4 protein [Chloroflexi bacterium]|nr:spherulation-specific family 4 protein [Chloroflexota bacterium]
MKPPLSVVYYGWLSRPDGTLTPAARRLLAARPELLIVAPVAHQPAFCHLRPELVDQFQAGGSRLFAYVATAYGRRDPHESWQEARRALQLGVDGILLDEVPHDLSPVGEQVCHELCHRIREAGGQVILNTGVAETPESLLELADILMLEHAWRRFALASRWRQRYPPARFLGVSSNEPGARRLLSSRVNLSTALAATRAAMAAGIGWHVATERYIRLPTWFEHYVAALRSEAALEGAVEREIDAPELATELDRRGDSENQAAEGEAEC